MAFVVKQEALFDPIQMRFLCQVSVILQPQSEADRTKSIFRWKQVSFVVYYLYTLYTAKNVASWCGEHSLCGFYERETS